MEAFIVKIINPKAKSLLLNLEEMDLIQIKANTGLSAMLSQLRRNEFEVPQSEEIEEEVEIVRQKRYDAKMQDCY